jgi:hypothetical protein
MRLPNIPDKIDDWNLETLNELVNFRDVESETFDFKGHNFNEKNDELYNHICAMANSSGGYIVLGIDEERSETDYLIRFIKTGFEKGEEDHIGQTVGNAMYNVELVPEIDIKHLYDDNDIFYTVLKIRLEETKKPFFTKNRGQCFIRIGNSSKPATRSIILNLAVSKTVSREDKKQHTDYLKEIYKKLTGIKYNTSSNGLIYLEVPENYNDYRVAYILGNVEQPPRYNDVKYLKHLDWAISHLKHEEYAPINQDWSKIQTLVQEYNKTVTYLMHLIEEHISTEMKNAYPSFAELKEVKESQTSDKYSVHNISNYFYNNLIVSLGQNSKPDFTDLKEELIYDGSLYAIIKIGILLQSQKQEHLQRDKLITILDSLYEEDIIHQRFKGLNNTAETIFKLCRQFSKKLEFLIDDFDGGDIIKGSCKLGF